MFSDEFYFDGSMQSVFGPAKVTENIVYKISKLFTEKFRLN